MKVEAGSSVLVLCAAQLVKPRILKAYAFIIVMWAICFLFFNKPSLRLSVDLSLTKYAADFVRYNSTSALNDGSLDHSNGSVAEAINNTGKFQNESLKSGQENATNTVETCQYPALDAFDPAVIALTKFHPPLNCEKGVPHLVYMSGYTIKVNHSKTALYANTTHPFKECRYKSITREPGSDYNTIVLYTSEFFKDEITPRDRDDDLIVECLNTNKTVISRSYFSLIRIRPNLELELEDTHRKHLALNSPKEVLNVLMIGLDGNSKHNVERHMPKTRNFLLNELKAIELHKYNKFGDSTFPNVLSLLTGKSWDELERANWTWAQHMDFINKDFLWGEFSKAGYRTGVFFDESVDTPFHFDKAWDKSPADYYMRATILERNKDELMKSYKYHCVGDIPEVTYFIDYWIKMASTFNRFKTKPYFGFSFFTHLTHDDHNMASAGDHLYLQFFQEMRDKNLINNTVIVYFSDHGQRFGSTRVTYNGMLESKMPHIFFVFPPWFHQKYSELIKVLKINQERLTTNRDVHATIRDLVNFQATTGKGNVSSRGISLFYEIPPERTCEQADIAMEFCLCHQMTSENISVSMNLHLSESIMWKLATLIRPFKEKCKELKYVSTKELRRIQPDDAVKEENKNDIALYQMTITTRPGNAIYEASVKFRHSTKQVEVVGVIMRLDMYKGQVECIDDLKLRPYCYCKK